eukprot:TRINITY_DN2038_c0_g1_i1.p1 TRINITY_DN2038_c0_g1~~TRINITY_DN2038_c0_g1_i1.p1  ORF type:complete len:273 (-),score=16.79 TRINITY_DN2038_c0_g1_i1:800-1618(-)
MIIIMGYALKNGRPQNLVTQIDINACQTGQAPETFCNLIRNGTNTSDQYVADIKVVWPLFFAILAIALFFGFVFLIAMRFLSGIMTWIMIILYVVVLAILGFLCLRTARNITTEDEAAGKPDDRATTRKVLTGLAVLLWVLDAITVLLIICFFNQIQLAIAILKAASDFLNSTPQTLIAPLVKILTLAALLSYWISIFIYLYSIGDLTRTQDKQSAFIQGDNKKGYIIAYHVFGLLWTSAFVVAIEQFVVASCAAMWYYASGSGQYAHNPVS